MDNFNLGRSGSDYNARYLLPALMPTRYIMDEVDGL